MVTDTQTQTQTTTDVQERIQSIACTQKSITVTVTEVQDTWRRCKRKWDLGSLHRQSLTKIVPSSALSLGTAIHHALAEWLRNPDQHPTIPYFESVNAMVERAKLVYRKQMGFNMDDTALQPIADIIELGKSMLENYVDYWGSPLPQDWKLIAYEQKAIVPIPLTPHFLQGRLDAIAQDQHGQLYVVDHKTYNSRINQDGLLMTDQFCGYTWMLTQLHLSSQPIAGLAYDGMWKRAAPPKGSTMNDLFTRINIPFNQHQLDEYALFTAMQATEMASDPFIYTNRTWDARCQWDCQALELCNAMTKGEDDGYIRASQYTTRSDDTLDDAIETG